MRDLLPLYGRQSVGYSPIWILGMFWTDTGNYFTGTGGGRFGGLGVSGVGSTWLNDSVGYVAK